MGIERIFRKKCKIHRKKRSDENNDDEITHSSEETFQIDYFQFIMDKFIFSIETRFEQLMAYEKLFGFLFDLNKLRSLGEDELKNYCLRNFFKFLMITQILMDLIYFLN